MSDNFQVIFPEMVKIANTDFEFAYFPIEKIVIRLIRCLQSQSINNLFSANSTKICSIYDSISSENKICIFINLSCDDFNISNPLLSIKHIIIIF